MTPNCLTFFKKKTSNKCNNLETFTERVLFLDYNKTNKKGKKVSQFGVMYCIVSQTLNKN